MPGLVHTAVRTARKSHVCVRCGSRVQPGQPYLRHSAAPGGDLGYLGWAHAKECAACAEKLGRPILQVLLTKAGA